MEDPFELRPGTPDLVQERHLSLPKFQPPTWSGNLPVPESPENSPRELKVPEPDSSFVTCKALDLPPTMGMGSDEKPLDATLEALPSEKLIEELLSAKLSESIREASPDSEATTFTDNIMYESEECQDALLETHPLFPQELLDAELDATIRHLSSTAHSEVTDISDTMRVLPEDVVDAAVSIA